MHPIVPRVVPCQIAIAGLLTFNEQTFPSLQNKVATVAEMNAVSRTEFAAPAIASAQFFKQSGDDAVLSVLAETIEARRLRKYLADRARHDRGGYAPAGGRTSPRDTPIAISLNSY